MKRSVLHALRVPAVALTIVMATGCDPGCGTPPDLPASRAVLLRPDSAAFRDIPPDTFVVELSTSAGPVSIEVVRAWSPMGAYRFYNLVRNGYYDGTRFHRVVPGFVAQFGASTYPVVERKWGRLRIPGDPIRVSNTAGTVAFAQTDKDGRTTQLFINLADNRALDAQSFPPIGRVVSGIENVARLNAEYGEMSPDGDGPRWGCMYRAGSGYLQRDFPRLDSVVRARVMAPVSP